MARPFHSSHKRTSPHVAITWPKEFRAFLGRITPEVESLWERFRESGDAEARLSLFNFYAPLAQIEACRQCKRNPELYSEAVEDLIGDTAIGLWRALDQFRPNFPVLYFFKFARRVIRKTLSREVLKRRGVRRREIDSERIINGHRARFIQEHGRVPGCEELAELIKGEFNNPLFEIERPKVKSISMSGGHDRKAARREMAVAISREAPPDARALRDETLRLMLKSVKPEDQPMLKMLLRGQGASEIAEHFQIERSSVYRRLRGLLWEARSRADLAEHAEATAVPLPIAPSVRIRTRAAASSQPESHRGFNLPERGGRNLPGHFKLLGLSTLPAGKLQRIKRTDAQIVELLRAGYSQRQILLATHGNNQTNKPRVSALQRQLIEDLAANPMRKVG